MLQSHPGGGGVLPLLKVVGTCRWTGYDFPVINIGTGYLNRPNWLLAGYSFYHRVASQAPSPTMFMRGPRSRHQRRQGCHSKFSFLPTTHGHFPLLSPTPIGQVLHTHVNREFSIAVNVPLVNGVERISARKSHACIPLYMHYNTYRQVYVCAMNTVQNVSLQSNMQLQKY